MANYCWNHVVFNGDAAKIKKLQEKFSKYEETNYFTEFGDYVLDRGKIGDDEETLKQRHDDLGYSYGTRWWDFTMDDIYPSGIAEDTELKIMGDSAWSPPIMLISEISKVYKVKAEIEYDEPGMDFAGKFTWNELGAKTSQWEGSSCEMRYNEDKIGWIEDRMFCYEGEDNSEYTYKKLREDYPYATKTHIRNLREQIIKLNE